MTTRQDIDMNQFYSILEGLKHGTADSFNEAMGELSDGHPTSEAFDAVEQADQQFADQMRIARNRIDQITLRDIEEAEDRLATGCFGLCSGCGCDIPKARLLVHPTAIRCVACQEKFEHHALEHAAA